MTHKFRMEVLRDVSRNELSGACLLPNHFGEIQKLTEIPCAFDNDFSMMYNYTKNQITKSYCYICGFVDIPARQTRGAGECVACKIAETSSNNAIICVSVLLN